MDEAMRRITRSLGTSALVLVFFACGSSDDDPMDRKRTDRAANPGGDASSDAGRIDGRKPGDDAGAGLEHTFIATGPGPHPGNSSHVRVLDGAGGALNELPDVFAGGLYGANVATCDVDGDGTSEIVVGAGPDPAGGTGVRVVTTTGTVIAKWDSTFEGKNEGAHVACGDVDGDKVPDVIVALGAGANNDTTVRIFDVKTLAKKGEFLAYGANVRYGVRIAAADVDGDGKVEIVTGPGPSNTSGAHVKVFSASGALVADVHAFDDAPIYGDFNAPKGAVVAAGDIDGDGKDEIVVTPGPAPLATPRVRIYSVIGGALTLRSEFVSTNPIPHLTYSGYFHVHDPSFGLHIPDVKDFTNWAFIWDTAYLQVAKDNGMKVVYDFQKIIRESPRGSWEANVKAIAPKLAAFKETIAVIYLVDEVDIFNNFGVADQNALTVMVKKYIPDIPLMMSYVNQTEPPASALDWVGIDPYINANATDEIGCLRRDYFDSLVGGRIAWAKSAGKPIVIIPPSFRREDPTPRYAMPTPCQQRWYLEAAIDEPLVKGVLWFMYGHAKKAERGEEVLGVVDHPNILAWHKAMFPATRLGGYGAELAVGDVDGDGKADILVGHGKGPGNTTMVNVHAADGTKTGAFRAYNAAAWGVSLAIGKRAP